MDMIKFSRFNLRSCFLAFFYLFAIAILAACSDSSDQGDNINAHITSAQNYLKQKQFRAATIEARNIIQKAPDDSTGYLLMAKIQLELGQPKSAIETLSIKPAEDDAEYLFILIEAYQQRAKYKTALDYLTKHQALLQKADPIRTLLLQGQTYFGLNQLDEARAHLTDLLSQDPENIQANLELVRIEASANNRDKAQDLLTELLNKNPQNVEALVLQAKLHLLRKEFAEGEDYLTRALAELPNSDLATPQRLEILQLLIDTLTQQGRGTEAAVYAKVLTEANPEGNQLRADYTQAVSLLKEGKVAESEELLKKILEQVPGHEKATQLLGIIKYYQGDNVSADKYLSENFDPEISSLGLQHVYAMTQLKLNRPDNVIQLLEKDIENITDPNVLGLYGLAALSADQHKKGEATLKRALEIAPEQTKLRLILARHYNKQADTRAQALEQIQEAYRQKPDDSMLQILLIQQHLHMNQGTEAGRLAEQIASKTDNAQILSFLATVQLQLGNEPKADQIIHKVEGINPGFAHWLYGEKAAIKKEPAKALQHYLDAWKTVPNDALAQKIYDHRLQLKQAAEASLFLEDWIAKLPDSTQARSVHATQLIGTKKYPEAITEYEKIKQMQNNNLTPAQLNNLAWAYLESGNIGEAVKHAEQAYSAAPKTAEIADTYGWILYHNKDLQKAQELLKQATELAPDNRDILDHYNQVKAEKK